jgi:hypothetical protein
MRRAASFPLASHVRLHNHRRIERTLCFEDEPGATSAALLDTLLDALP